MVEDLKLRQHLNADRAVIVFRVDGCLSAKPWPQLLCCLVHRSLVELASLPTLEERFQFFAGDEFILPLFAHLNVIFSKNFCSMSVTSIFGKPDELDSRKTTLSGPR